MINYYIINVVGPIIDNQRNQLSIICKEDLLTDYCSYFVILYRNIKKFIPKRSIIKIVGNKNPDFQFSVNDHLGEVIEKIYCHHYFSPIPYAFKYIEYYIRKIDK